MVEWALKPVSYLYYYYGSPPPLPQAYSADHDKPVTTFTLRLSATRLWHNSHAHSTACNILKYSASTTQANYKAVQFNQDIYSDTLQHTCHKIHSRQLATFLLQNVHSIIMTEDCTFRTQAPHVYKLLHWSTSCVQKLVCMLWRWNTACRTVRPSRIWEQKRGLLTQSEEGLRPCGNPPAYNGERPSYWTSGLSEQQRITLWNMLITKFTLRHSAAYLLQNSNSGWQQYTYLQ